MAVKKTTQAGDPILRAKAKKVTDIVSAKTKRVVTDLVDTMRDENLVGIAAPQIGQSSRIFVTEIRKTKLRKTDELDALRVFINPRILATSKREVSDWEGCGSVAEAGLFAKVKRPYSVTVEATDADGGSFTLKAKGLLARIILHENDHLDGRLFIDIANMSTCMSRSEYLKMRSKKK
jgi:peptide deformylase